MITSPVPDPLGMIYQNGEAHGAWWAPAVKRLEVLVEDSEPQLLMRDAEGWHRGDFPALKPGTDYHLRLDDSRIIPDPLSRHQPAGVHGGSRATDLAAFAWSDTGWRGRELADYIIYEVHIGTFTTAGTCLAMIDRLDDLVELGITAIELMPVAQCPGTRNWGYDGVYPLAVQHDLGGPAGLQALVDACHARGLAVVLDVVFNHLGPEGCYLGSLLSLTSDRYHTPWGGAINVDGPGSDGVRRLWLATAWQWFADFHIDALRLDAVHEIYDQSAQHFLQELTEARRAWAINLGRPLHLIAESDLNASRMIRPAAVGGHGLDAQWCDDFHHSLHVLLTDERKGFLADYGSVAHLRKAFTNAFVFDGVWSASRQRRHGDDAADLPTTCFVVCSQNHDQVGNRMLGERLPLLTTPAGVRCAAATVLLSPYIPLLFMGEEYGEKAPFLYFVDYDDPALIKAVMEGRKREFAALQCSGSVPDAHSPGTRDASRLDPRQGRHGEGQRLRAFYRHCLHLRQNQPSLRPGSRSQVTLLDLHPQVIAVQRQAGDQRSLLLINPLAEKIPVPNLPSGPWNTLLNSEEAQWSGTRELPTTPTGLHTLAGRHVVLLEQSS